VSAAWTLSPTSPPSTPTTSRSTRKPWKCSTPSESTTSPALSRSTLSLSNPPLPSTGGTDPSSVITPRFLLFAFYSCFSHPILALCCCYCRCFKSDLLLAFRLYQIIYHLFFPILLFSSGFCS